MRLLGVEELRPQLVFRELSVALILLLGFEALMVGSTSVGAEFTSGAIAPLLLVRPRRTPVWAAKLLAVGIGVGATAVLAWGAGVAVVLLAAVACASDNPSGPLVAALAEQSLRGAMLTTVAGVVGVAVTAAVRSTAAAIGLVIGYLVLTEVVGRAAALGVVAPWLLSHPVLAVVLGRFVVNAYSCERSGAIAEGSQEVIEFALLGA